MTLAQRFGRLLSEPRLRSLQVKTIHAGFREPAEVWIGSRIVLILLYLILGLAAGYLWVGIHLYLLAVSVAITLLLGTLFYLNLYYRILTRTRQLERVLPDFLLLVAANLRAGMTPFGAFVKAVRPEFGALYEEAKNAGARVGGRRSLGEALAYLTTRFESPVFERSMRLFTRGVESGSQLARLLTTNAEEIRRVQDMREELINTTRSYMIFIGFVVVIVMPFLLSVSAFFLRVFLGIQQQFGIEGGLSSAAIPIPLLSGNIGVRPEEVQQISILALVLTSFFSSMLMGVIRAGRWFYGVKYFPFIATAAVICLFLAGKLVGGLVQVGWT